MAFKGFGKSSGPEMPPQSQTPFGHFPRPPSPPTTFTPSIPNYSAIQRSPRAFGAPDQSLSPSSTVSGIHPATGLLHVSSTGNGPPLQWVDSENSVGRNFGNEMHIRLSASSVRPRANSASKMSWIPGPEARAPPHIYADDDIWMNSRDDSTGGHSELSIDDRGQLFPSRRQSPPLAFLSNHSNMDAYHPMDRTRRPGLSSDGWGNQSKLVSDSDSLLNRRSRSPTEIADALVSKHSRYPNLSSTDEVVQKSSRINQHEASERHSLSPPRLSTQKNVPGNPAFPNLRSSTTSHGVNSDNVVHKPASYAVSKRTRSPVSLVDQGFQEIQDDTERELQAKAKRLARFKAELSDPVENGPLGASRNFHSTKRDQSVTEKSVGEYSLGPTRDVGDEIDNEGSGSLSVIVGLCPDMCPESERAERERKGDLDQYERLDGDRNLTSKDLAVKKYNRTAEREAGLIRPLTILQKTMEYLLNLLDQPYDDCFLGLYNFLWDRMRAIRMDLRMQHIFNLEAIAMLEQMIRLHIIAMHELCEYTKGEGFSEGFDAHLNIEQMNKTSVELFQMYDDHRKKGVHVPTEKEFRGYYALLKLDKHPGYRVEPAELSLDLAKMTSEIRQTQEVLFARDVARSCRTGNFIAFFRLAKKASYLQACLMHAHFSKLRAQALASLHAGLQNNQGLPVAHVAKWLGMEAEDIESLLEYHGFLIKEFEEPYMVKEGPFLNNDRDYPTQCSELVHSKKSGTILEDVLSSHQVTSLPIEDDKELQLAKVKKREHTAALSIRTDGSFAIMDEEMSNSVMSSSPRYSMEIQHVPRMLRNAQQGSHQRSLASSPKGIVPVQPALEVANDHQQNKDFPQWTSQSSPMWNFSVPKFIPEAQPALYEWVDRPTANVPVVCSPETLICPEVKSTILDIMPRGVEQEKSTACLIDPVAERPLKHDVGVEELMGKETTDTQEVKEDEVVPSYYDEEVAEAKLKLLIRLWRRRSLRKRELREQNRIAASAALNVLPLGPPIWQNKHKPISYDKFDIDQVVCQRYVKHEKSFSRLNVSDVLASEFVERNANSNCICWKVVLGSQAHQSGKNTGHRAQAAHLSVQEWLHSKLLPCVKHENDDDLIVSIPGVSIWKKWFHDHSGGSTCCLSVVKDINFGNLNESVVGANAILYPVSESVPWETQKAQLHSLLTALPPGSHIPLLILSGSNEKEPIEPSSSIVDKLGLHDIDKSRIGSFLIVYIAESQDMRHLDSYFSDERLRKGLEWLAINSHRQPILCCIKTRDLVLTQLNSSLNALVQKGGHGIGPDHCISVFNEALDQSIGYIIAAANVNPLGWPCPELSLLDKSTDEYKVVNWFLPTIGWSSAERVEPPVSGLRHSKLPAFSDDLSWLTRGYNMGKGIEEQRQCLQDSLVRYLTQSSNMMNTALATKEANVILQKFTRLELHDTSYYLVPSWVPIFHRIFNWRLNILAYGACASAYILEQHHFSLLVLQKLAVEATPSMCDHPSLDEMVEISRGLILSERVCPEPPRASQPIPTMIEVGYNAVKATKTSTSGSNPEEVEKSSYMVDTARHGSRNQLVTVDVNLSRKFEEHSEVLLTLKAARETDRLSKLLEQCNILQNKNEEKLWVYF